MQSNQQNIFNVSYSRAFSKSVKRLGKSKIIYVVLSHHPKLEEKKMDYIPLFSSIIKLIASLIGPISFLYL